MRCSNTMTDPSETRALLEEFVGLAMARRRHAVSSDAKARMHSLENRLRDVVDGARPAPKALDNPRPVVDLPDVAPAQIEVSPSAEAPSTPTGAKPLNLDAFADQIPLSATDAAKTNDIVVDRQNNTYTPPKAPAFMLDYYAEDLVPAAVGPQQRPTKVVNVEGRPGALPREARTLLGIGLPSRAPDGSASERAGAASSVAGLPTGADALRTDVENPPLAAPLPVVQPSTARPPTGPQAVVYLLDGSPVRGVVPNFDPSGESIELVERGKTNPATIEMSRVMAVFLRVQAGRPATPAEGSPVTVRLKNDREVSGVTPDYQPGAMSLTVVPEPRHGNVDRVWIPAWAVKAIEMDDVDE